MKLKPGQRVALINAPAGVTMLNDLSGSFDWVQIFVKNTAELDTLTPLAVRALKPESLLWVSFPKGTSKIQTDLTRDKGWDTLQKAGLKWLNLISVNDTWSALLAAAV